jgi:hypothetical protein
VFLHSTSFKISRLNISIFNFCVLIYLPTVSP